MSGEAAPIPARLNGLIVAGVIAAAAGSLMLASNLAFAWQLPLAVAFACVMLTLYALMHEAAHGLLHPVPAVNYALGVALGWLFPMAFTVFRVTHVVHHCCNRTDHELFDYYYPGDNRLIKRVQWYGIMFGLWYLLIPIGNVLLALVPGLFHSRLFTGARTTAVLFNDFDARAVRRLRLEVAGGMALWTAAFASGLVAWQTAALCYALFGFNWSTRQFVTHAFTERSVRSGALNLSTSWLHQCLLLNGHWDQVHHEHPHLSWRDLPGVAGARAPTQSYARQYLRLWRGPQPCTQPGPVALERLDYETLA